jgi:F-type H+-transporting ATPase subunit b
MLDFLNNEYLWLIFSFIIFMYILVKYGKATIMNMLDGKIDAIRKDISEAESLRVEAQELLAQYQRKQRDAEGEAESIIAKAEQHALEIRKNAEKNLAESLQRREAQMKDRLAQMEEAALQQIREHASNLAIQATAQIIADKMDKKGQDKLLDQSVEAVSKNLH